MAKPIARLNIDLVANVAQLRRDFGKALGMASQFRTGIVRELGAGLARTLTSTLGAAIRSFPQQMRRAFEELDVVAKASDKLGIATEDLQAFTHAAEQAAGMTDRQLRMALQRMTRRIAEAAIGTGEAKDVLEKLGVDAQKLNKMGPAKAFEELAEKVSQLENSGEQLRVAFKLFDSEGAQLVNVLKLGRKGVEDFRREAERLGILLSREQLARIEAANDAWDEFGKVFRGLRDQIAVGLAPAMATLAELAREFVQAILPSRAAIEAFFRALTLELAAAATMMDQLVTSSKAFWFWFKSIDASLTRGVGMGDWFGISEEQANRAREAWIEAAEEFNAASTGRAGEALIKRMDEILARVKRQMAEIGGDIEAAGGGAAGAFKAPPATRPGEALFQKVLAEVGATGAQQDVQRQQLSRLEEIRLHNRAMRRSAFAIEAYLLGHSRAPLSGALGSGGRG